MRILVISDSHRDTRNVIKAIEAQPTAKHIFFLGDMVSDVEDLVYQYDNKIFHIVSGNCDFCSSLPSTSMENIEGIGILYTHGHPYSVKYGTDMLLDAAKQRKSRIALYGHTHISQILYEDGVYIVNPGSVSRPRESKASYAYIDIEKNQIMPVIVEL